MQRLLLSLICVLVPSGCALGWFLGIGRDGRDLSETQFPSLYTEALASGQSYLKVQPDPRVLAAPDPFNSEARGLLLYDASLYRGRYYLYFGIVPFALLLVPWYLVTGTVLTPAAVILLACLSTYVAYGLTLLIWARRSGLPPRPLWFAAAFLSVIVGSSLWPLAARPAIYELENAAAQALLAWAILALAAAESGWTGRWGRPLAGLFAALTVGCRPNYVPAVALIAGWIIWRSWPAATGARIWRRAPAPLLTLLPMVAVAFALGAWNVVRFGNPKEFGLTYTVSQDPALQRPLNSVSNLPYLLHRYTLGAAQLGPYFPFVEGPREGSLQPAPRQETSNQVYGFLWTVPVLIGALGLLRRRGASGTEPAPAFASLLGLLSLGNFLFICSIPMSSYRYPADFLGPLALLAGAGWLRLGEAPRRSIRWSTGGALALTLAWSASVMVCVSFSVAIRHMDFDVRRADDFARAARPFNTIAQAWEKFSGRPPAAVAMSVTFPVQPASPNEPLAVFGAPGEQDFFYVHYARAGAVSFGFESSGQGGLLSPAVELDFTQPHRLELRTGSMLPPDDHPLLREMQPADVQLARSLVTVLLDGRVVLDGRARFHRPRGRIQIGASQDDAAFGTRFSGKLAEERAPLPGQLSPVRLQPAAYGPITLTVSLVPLPPGVGDPLLAVGLPRQGALLLAEHLADGKIRLIWHDASGRTAIGRPLDWPFHQPVTVRVEAGALLPAADSPLWPATVPASEREARRRQLRVVVDGRLGLMADVPTLDCSPAHVVPGRDTLGLRGGVMPTCPGVAVSGPRDAWP